MRAKLIRPVSGLLLALIAWPVLAIFHLMKVVEVFPGTAAAPLAQYVVIQMYSSGQNLVAGHDLIVYDSAGVQVATYTFPANVSNGANQAKILIATPQAETFFGVNADLTMSATLMSGGGKVCFEAIDCVAWGAYTGPSTGVGTPFNATSGIPVGRAALRRLDIVGSATVLDSGDDTNNCATDFVSGLPVPRNNAGMAGAPPGATCGNGVIEGLEQCDDHNTNSGDGCSSTCMIDTPVASLSVGDVSLNEGNSGTRLANFVVRLSQASPSPVSYNVTTANGTATAGSDYLAKSLTGETIPAGQTSRAFSVTVNGDGAREADETFFANVTNVTGASVTDAQGRATIVNDDNPMLSIADVSIAEGNSGTRLATFTVKLSQASASPVTYSIATANGTAVAGSDYGARSLSGETIPAGQTSRTFAVTINGDTSVEPNETFSASISGASVSVSDGFANGFILNDDGPTLSIADLSFAEGNSGAKQVVFVVRLSQAAAGPVTYNIATANGTATAGSDYVARSLSGEVIPAGQTSRNFGVTINGDTSVEANETFTVTLSGVTGATLFDSRSIATILNDDGVTLSIADMAVAEGNAGTKTATFTVRLSKAAAVPVSYNITTGNSSASAGSDYVARLLTGESIPAGQLSRSFAVTINGDTAVESNESFLVTLGTASGATIFDGTAIGTILNDDGPTLSIADLVLSEGNSGTKIANFTVRLSQAAAGPVTYAIATANGSATAGSDYVAKSLVNETIPAGQTSRSFPVTINGDTAVEANEVFGIGLGGATGATIFDGQASATLLNDDGPTLSVGDVSVVEGDSGTKQLVFTISLSQTAGSAVTYNITTANGTASAGTDYVARTLLGETIPAGQASRTFAVTINGDTTVEGLETFTVNLGSATGATIFDGIAIGQITNDDP